MSLFFKPICRLALLLSLAILSSTHAFASKRDIIVITYNKKLEAALLIDQILKAKLKIPPILIKLKQMNIPCKKIKEAILQICINQGKEMHFPVMKQAILKESFAVFLGKSLEGNE